MFIVCIPHAHGTIKCLIRYHPHIRLATKITICNFFFEVYNNIELNEKDDLSRFVLISLHMRMQEFSAGIKNINKDADQ